MSTYFKKSVPVCESEKPCVVLGVDWCLMDCRGVGRMCILIVFFNPQPSRKLYLIRKVETSSENTPEVIIMHTESNSMSALPQDLKIQVFCVVFFYY